MRSTCGTPAAQARAGEGGVVACLKPPAHPPPHPGSSLPPSDPVWRALDEAGAPQAVGTCLAYVCGRVEEECGFGPGSTLHSLFQQYHAGGLGDREAGLVEVRRDLWGVWRVQAAAEVYSRHCTLPTPPFCLLRPLPPPLPPACQDFFQAVHARLRSRTARAADNLAAPGRGGAGPALPSTFAEAALVTADALYTQRTELLFGPHLSATVVCVLYGESMCLVGAQVVEGNGRPQDRPFVLFRPSRPSATSFNLPHHLCQAWPGPWTSPST